MSGELGINSPEEEESDVGWFEDLYDTVDVISGGWLPGGPVDPFGSPVQGPVVITQQPPPVIGQGPVVAPPPMAVSGDPCNQGPSPVYKKVCGQYKWIYPKRRRRRALATKSDIKALASIKGVLGGGKAMETWIATHS